MNITVPEVVTSKRAQFTVAATATLVGVVERFQIEADWKVLGILALPALFYLISQGLSDAFGKGKVMAEKTVPNPN